MARISPREFLDLPLRVHSFLRDVLLHDVWVVDLPSGREGITLHEFRSRSRAERADDIPNATKALLQIRFFLGRVFRLDTTRPGQKSDSYIRQLTEADRVASLVPPGSKDGIFEVAYLFQNEMLLEIINATVHAFWAQTLTQTSTGYRLYCGDIRETLLALDHTGIHGSYRSVPPIDRLSANSVQSTRAMA